MADLGVEPHGSAVGHLVIERQVRRLLLLRGAEVCRLLAHFAVHALDQALDFQGDLI